MAVAPKAIPAGDIDQIDAKLAEELEGAGAAEADDAKGLADWAQAELGLALDPVKLTVWPDVQLIDALVPLTVPSERPGIPATLIVPLALKPVSVVPLPCDV